MADGAEKTAENGKFFNDATGIFRPSNIVRKVQEDNDETVQDLLMGIDVSHLSANILNYIAGYVVKRILERIDCHYCQRLLKEPAGCATKDDHNYSGINPR